MSLKFGEFELDEERRQLLRSGQPVPLEPKAYELLWLLVERRPKALSRPQIHDVVWPDTFISESTLGVVINNLRQALGDDARDPRFIRTVRGFGYSFCGEVRREVAVDADAQGDLNLEEGEHSNSQAAISRRAGRPWGWLLAGAVAIAGATAGVWLSTRPPTPVDSAAIRSLVVLPFENLSKDPAEDYFAAGMHDALTTALSKVGALRVISRTSANRYKGSEKPIPEIAKELSVDAVVEGAVLQEGDRVRITAQLIHGASDVSVWAGSYDRRIQDVLKVHDEIALTIAREVAVALSPQEERHLGAIRAVDPEAYREFLKGEFMVQEGSPEAHRTTMAHYRAAIEIDPAFAPAHAGLSFALVNNWWEWMDPDAVPEARRAARRALELDDALPEAHIAVGNTRWVLDWDWDGADAAFRRGYELNPRSTFAHLTYVSYLRLMERFDEALSLGRAALDLDPLSPAAHLEMVLNSWCAGRVDDALRYGRRYAELEPHSPAALAWPVFLGGVDSPVDGAFRLRQAESLLRPGTRNVGAVGFAYARLGQRADALRVLDRLEQSARSQHVFSTEFAEVYAGLGETKRPLEWLERAYEERDPGMLTLKVSPWYESLRGEPRFQQLLARMDFPE
jgi:TolB-like protein/DNA-binding winged helix-turn-helix (wHTH) protein/tetratricopeptide (TPR) repeat protein